MDRRRWPLATRRWRTPPPGRPGTGAARWPAAPSAGGSHPRRTLTRRAPARRRRSMPARPTARRHQGASDPPATASQAPLGRVDLQIKDRCVRQPILHWLPIEPLVRRVPNADVGPDIQVGGCLPVHDQSIVLYIEQIVAIRRPAANLPLGPVEPPDS